ncbi:MAG: hypothetical protein ACON5H_10240 [Akkermansiaceae bacterium]
MKGIITIIKVFAALGVLAIVGGLFVVLKDFKKDFAKPADIHDEKLVELQNVDFERGKREFNRALELIAMERLEDAREKLLFIQNLHADSEFGPEARRILGEINLDEVLSVSNMKNKQVHVVQPGRGAPLAIAKKYKTTLDCLMFLNGFLDMSVLHPGDEIIVMPLGFKIVIDLANKRVVLYHRDFERQEHIFTKEYLIQRTDISKIGSRPVFGSIRTKIAEVNGRAYQPFHSQYRHGSKILIVEAGRRHIQIRRVPEIDEEDPGQGVFLRESDMEELAMLIRLGNEVEIKPAN